MGSVMKNIFAFMATTVCIFALATTTASASVITDCNDNGSIDRKYSTSQLKNALRNIPADVDQYSDCRSLIQQALLNSFSKKDKGPGSDSNNSASLSQVVSKGERKKVEKEIDRATRLPMEGAVADIASANINRSGARSLASSAAPGVSAAPLVALIGLMLLLSANLVGRLAKQPALQKILPTRGRGVER